MLISLIVTLCLLFSLELCNIVLHSHKMHRLTGKCASKIKEQAFPTLQQR